MMPYLFKHQETGEVIGTAWTAHEKLIMEAKFSGKNNPHPVYGWAPRKDGSSTMPKDYAEMRWRLGKTKFPPIPFTVEETPADELANRVRRQVSFYPWHSDGAGVNPDQIPAAYAQSVKDGVPTQFDSQGRAIFTSPGHRARYLKANAIFDRKHGQRETSGPCSSLSRR